MNILMVLDYFSPHTSGLTVYVKRLSEELVKSGHEVTVLTSRYEPNLPSRESVNGIRVVREWVAFRFYKGVAMPFFPLRVLQWALRSDVVHVHLPQPEAGMVALVAKGICRKKVVITYHCDIQLPPGWLYKVIRWFLEIGNRIAAALADQIISYTEDYRDHSPFLHSHRDKVAIIPPPITVCDCVDGDRDRFRQSFGLEKKTVIGMAARFAAEKGIEFVLQSLDDLQSMIPNVHLLFAGEYRNVMGEHRYFDRLKPLLERHRDSITFTGVLQGPEMGCFFRSIHVLIVSSINSTESFGLVQGEAMLHGTPVVATDIPGVRVPIRLTGMGLIVPKENPGAIRDAVVRILVNRDRYILSKAEIEKIFGTEVTRDMYITLFKNLLSN